MPATTTKNLMVLHDVKRTFLMGEVEVPVLRGVNLELPAGRLTILLGPSGSGKTTLLNLLGGLDRPDSGSVKFEDQDLGRMTDRELTTYRRRSVGFVFQFYNLIPTLTAAENVEVVNELVDDSISAREALSQVGLHDRADHFPAQLSGGEQQRVAIARALAKRPSLLLCDEPTGALDRDTGRVVLGVLRRICDELGMTAVIVTHNTAIAAIGDRIVRIGSGVIESVKDQDPPMPIDEVKW